MKWKASPHIPYGTIQMVKQFVWFPVQVGDSWYWLTWLNRNRVQGRRYWHWIDGTWCDKGWLPK